LSTGAPVSSSKSAEDACFIRSYLPCWRQERIVCTVHYGVAALGVPAQECTRTTLDVGLTATGLWLFKTRASTRRSYSNHNPGAHDCE
jgi:hypothetical protein